MTRSTPFRFSLFEISFAILAALALAFSPQAALAQHGGGGGHAGGGHAGGGGHFAGAGHTSGGAGFGASGHSFAGSHVSSSPIHVFSGPRSAPVADAPARAAENSAALMSERAQVSAIQSSSWPRAFATFAQPRGSSEAAAALHANPDSRLATPMHTTIGFPPSTDPRVVSMAGAHRGAPLMIAGQGREVWQSSPDAAANRNMPRITESRPPQRALPKPPHIFQRPFLGGAPFLIGSPGFVFFTPAFGFFGPGFGCDPFLIPSFGCNTFSPFGFGGFGFLGFDGGFGDAGYGYDGGYYAPPTFDVTPPNPGEGASQEPAPSGWQNPPAESNSGAENERQTPAPDTIIYLKDGTSFAVKGYWVADGKLHYVASYGGENAVDLGDLDLERTTDANASRGVSITLRPAPESSPPAPNP